MRSWRAERRERLMPCVGIAVLGLVAIVSPLAAQAQTSTQTVYLHGSGGTANPPTLFVDTVAPAGTTAKYKDSAGVTFSGGNVWKSVGNWTPAAGLNTATTLTALGPLHVWLGLKNSDDQGTRFDLLAEATVNGTVVSSGLLRCITGITRNPSSALEVTVPWSAFSPVPIAVPPDALQLRIWTRIGTNSDNSFCGGHSNAVGLRLYFDATNRAARLGVTTGGAVPTPTTLLPNPLSVAVGNSGTLTATLSPSPAAPGSLTVVSAAPGIASVPASVPYAVGQTGVAIPVQGVAIGNAQITVSTTAGQATSMVHVMAPTPTISSLLPAQETLTQGANGTLTVTISAAQSSATTVSIESSASGIVSVPALVTIPAGQPSAPVPLSANSPGSATVTVTLNGSTAASTITVTPAPPTVVSLQPPTQAVTVGATGTLTVTISATQASGTSVALTASPTGIVSVPSSVTVPAGSLSATVPFTALALGSTMIQAGLNSSTADAVVQVTPPAPAVVSLLPSPLTLAVGATGQLTVTLNAAQSTDQHVTLTASPSGLIQLPPSVTVLAGHTEAHITVSGTAVGTATVTASLAGSQQQASVQVVPPAPTLVSLLPSPFPIQQGATGTMTLTISADQPTNTTVLLTNSAPSILQAPDHVIVPAGQTSATFSVTALLAGTATLTATLNGSTASSTIQIAPPPPVVVSLVPVPAPPSGPLTLPKGIPGTLRVTMDRAATAATEITLASASTGVATVPPTVTVPAGLLSADVPVMTVGEGASVISASLNNTTATATVVVTPAVLVQLTIAPLTPTIVIGQMQAFTAQGTFTDGQVLDVTNQVTWFSSNTAVATIGSTGLATGQAAGTATIMASGAGYPTTVSVSTLLTVQTPPPLSLSPATANLQVGGTLALTAGTATAPGPGGLTVTFSTSGTGAVTLPPSVVIPEGLTNAQIMLTATAPGPVAVTASAPLYASATSNVLVLNPVPTIASLSPSEAPTGSAPVTITVTGTGLVAGATLKFGTTVLSTAVQSPTSLTAVIPTAALSPQGSVGVTVQNPAPGGGTSNQLTFTLKNGAPVLNPIGNPTIGLGNTLNLGLTSTDPDHDPVRYMVTSALPPGMSFNAQTGQLTFTPNASQVGTFNVTFVATDGSASTQQTATFTVTGALPGGTTGVSGRVTDTSGHPLASVTVYLKATGQQTTTNSQGTFTLNGVPSGRQQLLIDGRTAGDFAILVGPVDLIPNVTTNVPTAFSLPPIDNVHAVPINPAVTTVVSNPTLPNVTVTIAPGAAKNADGTLYTGSLSISPVPEYGRPESRPVELRPGFSITIQPAGIVIDPPAAITLPNVDNMPTGNNLDLWSLSPDTGTFIQAGTMRVSADGQRIETVTGGVRKTAWHFFEPITVQPAVTAGNNTDRCLRCEGLASAVDLTFGALSEDVVIPGIRSLGVSRDLRLHYRSTSADVRPILPLNATLSFTAAVPQTFSARLTLGGVVQGDEVHWNASGLSETATSTSRMGVQVDASALPTGRYPYEVMLFSNYAQSSIGAASNGQMLVRNERASPFGAGWTMTGVDRIYPQANGNLVLAHGDGTTQVFATPNRPLVIESLSEARSFAASGVSLSFVTGGVYAQARQDLSNPANFGLTGIVPRPVTFRSGLTTITSQGLDGVDIFVINRPISQLASSELGALEDFVKNGGAILEMWPFGPGRYQLLGTTGVTQISDSDAVFTVDGLNSSLAAGPFGSVTSPFATGSSSYYGALGQGVNLANNNNGPTLLQLPPGTVYTGQGRAILFGDSEAWASGYQGGGTNLYAAGTNRILFLNTIAYLAQTPGYKPAPAPSTASFQGPPGDYSTLVKNVDGTYTRTLKDGTRYQFDAQGLQIAMSDRNGNTTAYAYDSQGRVTSIVDPAGQSTTLSYGSGRLTSITDPAGRTTTFQHDGDGNLLVIRQADASRLTFTYDAQRRMIRRTDARDLVYRYDYDHAGRIKQAVLPTNEVRQVVASQRAAVPNVAAGEGTRATPAALAAAVNQATLTDALNHITTFELDSLSSITKQTDALNRVTAIVRDANGNPTKITRPNGAIMQMTYDATGNLLTSTEQAIGATTTFTYDATFNQVRTIRDPRNNLTTITYDAKGNPITVTDAANQVTTFTYDARGLLLTTRDALNQTTTFTYDAQGRLLTTTDPLNRTTTLAYDAAGNVATSTDALGRVTAFTYDAKNRLTQVTDPAAGLTRYAYDGHGNLLTVTDAKNQTTTFAYDALNRLATTTDPLNRTETYTYDGANNLRTRVTPKAETISFAYDAVNQLLTKTLPGNLVTSYTYDSVGNLTGVTDPDSRLTMGYDLANRLTSVNTSGSSNQPAVTVGYTYDLTGNRLTQTANGQTLTSAYDALNRLTSLNGATPVSLVPAPDLLAWWKAEGDALDQTGGHPGTLVNGTTFAPGVLGQAFAFDGVNDGVTFDSTIGNFGTSDFTVEFWMKATSARREALVSKRPSCGHGVFWDIRLWDGGKLVVELDQNNVNYHVIFGTRVVNDGQPHRIAITRQGTTLRLYVDGVLDGTSTTAGIVNMSNTTTAQAGADVCIGSGDGTQPFTGLLDELAFTSRAKTQTELTPYTDQAGAAYVYDALSRRTSVTLTNGTVTTYSYDAGSQLMAISHQLAATSQLINQASYVYNGVGNRTSLTDRRGVQNFGYDALDRLTSASHPLLATPQAFSYDPVGNRTTNGSVHNAGNQLTADANYSYQYDLNGNLTRKMLTATGQHTDYTYDAENRLIQVQEFAAGSSTPIATSTYRYDGLGRRIEKVANGQTKRYIYDGEDIVLEYDGSNVLQARYTHGPGIDEPIAVTRGSSTYFYHQDGLGTATDLTDSAGVIAKSYSYDAYGTLVDQTGTLDQPYTYTGREFDSESGLYYYRARHYDSRTGRFLQRDPVGISSGTGNHYLYVGGSPISLRDSFGLCPGDLKKCIDDFLRNLYGEWANLLVHHFSLASLFLGAPGQVALNFTESVGAKAALAGGAFQIAENLTAKGAEILSRPASDFGKYFGIYARAEAAAASSSLAETITATTKAAIRGGTMLGGVGTLAATGIHLQAYEECKDKDP